MAIVQIINESPWFNYLYSPFSFSLLKMTLFEHFFLNRIHFFIKTLVASVAANEALRKNAKLLRGQGMDGGKRGIRELLKPKLTLTHPEDNLWKCTRCIDLQRLQHFSPVSDFFFFLK